MSKAKETRGAAKAGDRSKSWDGGYIRVDSRGREKFYIRRRINGHLYDLSTGATSSTAAHDQLKRFEANPEEYRASGGEAPDESAPRFTTELVSEFLAWSAGKGNGRDWQLNQRATLAWWAEDANLAGHNLRRLNLAEDILKPTERVPGKWNKIKVLKTFLAWLRTEKHLIAVGQDPTFGQLHIVASRPAQERITKYNDPKHHAKLVEALRKTSPWYADLCDLLAATGWHMSEAHHFAVGGTIEGNVIMTPKHKKGIHHRTEVSPAVVAVAERVIAHGGFSLSNFQKTVRDTCRALKIDVKPGRYRHTVAKLAVDAGHTMQEVADFLGHNDSRTTKRHYATHATPKKIKTLL